MTSVTITLSGSDKQIKWAVSIRSEMIASINRTIAAYEQAVAADVEAAQAASADIAEARTLFALALSNLDAHTDAGWYISNQSLVGKALIRALIA